MDGAKDIPAPPLYERDFYAWTEAQARALKARDWEALDLENVIEEIETLGRSERSALRSVLVNILEHKIKLDHGLHRDPEPGWRVTVKTQRVQAADLLEENPSLRRELSDMLDSAYRTARKRAMISFEDHEPDRLVDHERSVPETCPYPLEDVLG